MAQRQHGVVPDQDHYCCCTICLGRLTEPVTLPCGHSYCRSCIEVCWDQQGEQRRDYSCPQCRETFSPRPVLRKNNILAEVVENLRRTGGQSSAAEAISDRATARPLEKCSIHDEPKKVYCRTDQQCICLLCAMDHHKGHDTVSTLAERTDKQKQVVTSQQKVQQKIQERKKELKDLIPSIEFLKLYTEAAVADSDKISCELTRSKVKELIRDQEKAAVTLQRSLEEQIAQLERRNAELEELSSADDIHFIQSFRSLSMSTASPVFECGAPDGAPPPQQGLPGLQFLSSGIDSSEEEGAAGPATTTWQTMFTTPGPTARQHGVPTGQADSPKPQTRKDFLQFFHPLTLDTNTAHKNLRLSENNRTVAWVSQAQSYPAHPERFTVNTYVMCTKGLTGRCYWEAEWRGTVDIAVSYREYNRKDSYRECHLGWNDRSWTLECHRDSNKYTVRHNSRAMNLTISPSNRVAVYLDFPAGTLSFYRVSYDTLTHLHTFQNKFSQPLYPVFFTDFSSKVSLCQ